MNFLAHLYLADSAPPSVIGNLIADGIKGSDLAWLPPGIEQGVRMHRSVDSFTDCHPSVLRGIGRISPQWSWFSGILIDVWFDHILATNWPRWSRTPLRDFIDGVHRILRNHVAIIPVSARELIDKLLESDRLFTYRTIDGIADALSKLSDRIRERLPKHPVRLEEAIDDLRRLSTELEADFNAFFPSLIAHVERWKISHPSEPPRVPPVS